MRHTEILKIRPEYDTNKYIAVYRHKPCRGSIERLRNFKPSFRRFGAQYELRNRSLEFRPPIGKK